MKGYVICISWYVVEINFDVTRQLKQSCSWDFYLFFCKDTWILNEDCTHEKLTLYLPTSLTTIINLGDKFNFLFLECNLCCCLIHNHDR